MVSVAFSLFHSSRFSLSLWTLLLHVRHWSSVSIFLCLILDLLLLDLCFFLWSRSSISLRSSSMADDLANPFILRHSDNPGLALVSQQLTEDIYASWSYAMKIALCEEQVRICRWFFTSSRSGGWSSIVSRVDAQQSHCDFVVAQCDLQGNSSYCDFLPVCIRDLVRSSR